MGAGLRQGLLSRAVLSSNCKRLISSTMYAGQKEKAIYTREEDELSKDLVQKHGRDYTNRYDDNLYA